MSDIIQYLSLSGLLHLVWSSRGPFLLLQMAWFHSFLWLNNTSLHLCVTSSLSIPPHFFAQSSVNGYLGGFYVLANVNSATMNIGVLVSFQIMIFYRYMPRSRTVGWYGSFIFGFLLNFLFCIGVQMINKQCCDSFGWTMKGLSLTYTCILFFVF